MKEDFRVKLTNQNEEMNSKLQIKANDEDICSQLAEKIDKN